MNSKIIKIFNDNKNLSQISEFNGISYKIDQNLLKPIDIIENLLTLQLINHRQNRTRLFRIDHLQLNNFIDGLFHPEFLFPDFEPAILHSAIIEKILQQILLELIHLDYLLG